MLLDKKVPALKMIMIMMMIKLSQVKNEFTNIV